MLGTGKGEEKRLKTVASEIFLRMRDIQSRWFFQQLWKNQQGTVSLVFTTKNKKVPSVGPNAAAESVVFLCKELQEGTNFMASVGWLDKWKKKMSATAESVRRDFLLILKV